MWGGGGGMHGSKHVSQLGKGWGGEGWGDPKFEICVLFVLSVCVSVYLLSCVGVAKNKNLKKTLKIPENTQNI